MSAAEDLDAYAIGWVDGAARRPLTDRSVLTVVCFSGIDVIAAFELGREVERRRSAEGAAVQAEVEESLRTISDRLLGAAGPPPPRSRRPRAKRHLRAVT